MTNETNANEIETPPITKQPSKKTESKVFSEFLNPNFDLKNHNSLISFIYEYQREQLNKKKLPKGIKHFNAKLTNDNHERDGENLNIGDSFLHINRLISSDRVKLDACRNICVGLVEKFQNYAKLNGESHKADLFHLLSKFIMEPMN